VIGLRELSRRISSEVGLLFSDAEAGIADLCALENVTAKAQGRLNPERQPVPSTLVTFSASMDDMCHMPVDEAWKLPPLILHPFSRATFAPGRAGLPQGLHNASSRRRISPEAMRERILDGRYREITWLFYIGKDVVRWIEQCLEFVRSREELRHPNLRFQSFAALLTENPPPLVRDKLQRWGVLDIKSIFSRAIGINSLFAQLPAFEALSEEFLRNYYSYADCIFACRQNACTFTRLEADKGRFDLYSSGEYASILERGLTRE
jgi:hypothetical protein